MLWRHLRLRTRLLLGYGLMFVLFVALIALLMFRSSRLNAQIQALSARVTTEAAVGARLTAEVANAQIAIDRYLQQPQPEHLQASAAALQRLNEAVDAARAVLVEPEQRQRLDSLAVEQLQYQAGFDRLSGLLDAQLSLRARLNVNVYDAVFSLNNVVTLYLRNQNPNITSITDLVRAQQNLQMTTISSAHLISEQSERLGDQALENLSHAEVTLQFQQAQLDEITGNALGQVLDNAQQVKTTIAEYQTNLAQVREQRETLLNMQGERLKAQSDAIARAALERLAAATSDLERQSLQTQQLTWLALLLALLVTAGFGWLMPRTMTRPLLELVDATRRLNQGDTDVEVATRDGSEIGELAGAFNQMAEALSQEREEISRQQRALSEQNCELEQALAELKTSAAAREQLAVAVRTLSVPVVPILRQVILIPLVGEIDAERAEMLLERLLDGITTQQARLAILDITGVPVVDASLVTWLLRAMAAAQLMGARCIMVGISPEVAQALVSSGVDVSTLATRADLRGAVEFAIGNIDLMSAHSGRQGS
jgi:anti-anti-sigma factor